MIFSYDLFRDYVPKGFTEWLGEELLPLPLGSCIFSAGVMTKEIVSTMSDDETHSYVATVYNGDMQVITDIEEKFDEGAEEFTMFSHEPIYVCITRVHDLKADVLRTAVIHSPILAKIGMLLDCKKLVMSGTYGFEMTLHSINQVFVEMVQEETYYVELLQKIFGGSWKIIDMSASEFQHQVSVSMHTQNLEELNNPENVVKKRGVVLPSLGKPVIIENSEVMDKAFETFGGFGG